MARCYREIIDDRVVRREPARSGVTPRITFNVADTYVPTLCLIFLSKSVKSSFGTGSFVAFSNEYVS